MKDKETFGRTRAKAFSLIDLKGQEGGEVVMRIGGHRFDTIKMKLDFPELYGKPNDDTAKCRMITRLLEGGNQHRINQLVKLMTPEEMVHLFLNYREYQRLASLTEEVLDSDPHNKVAFAKAVVRDIVKPFGLEFEVENSTLGVNITIGIKGHNYQLN